MFEYVPKRLTDTNLLIAQPLSGSSNSVCMMSCTDFWPISLVRYLNIASTQQRADVLRVMPQSRDTGGKKGSRLIYLPLYCDISLTLYSY